LRSSSLIALSLPTRHAIPWRRTRTGRGVVRGKSPNNRVQRPRHLLSLPSRRPGAGASALLRAASRAPSASHVMALRATLDPALRRALVLPRSGV
jgi:hypothetical protein